MDYSPKLTTSWPFDDEIVVTSKTKSKHMINAQQRECIANLFPRSVCDA